MKLNKVIDNKDGDYHFENEQGKWQRECIYYWSNGNIMFKRYYKDDKLHGICTYYKENGEIDYKRYYWNDVKISEKEYYKNLGKEENNMKLKKVIDNKDGNYHHEDKEGNWQGECGGYWSNGNIMYKYYYKDDKRHGISTWYNENGEINYKEYYWNGEEISEKEYYKKLENKPLTLKNLLNDNICQEALEWISENILTQEYSIEEIIPKLEHKPEYIQWLKDNGYYKKDNSEVLEKINDLQKQIDKLKENL